MPWFVATDRRVSGVTRVWVEAARRALTSSPADSWPVGGVDEGVDAAWLKGAFHDLERAAGTPAFAVRAATAVSPDALGMVSFAWAARPTVGEGIASLDRYFRLLDPKLRLRTRKEDPWTSVWLELPAHTPVDLASRTGVEFLWAHLIRQYRAMTDVSVRKVTFRHGPVPYRDAYDEVFQAPVEFGREVDSMLLPTSLLGRRQPPYDCSVGVRVRRGAIETLRALPEVPGTSSQVREVILDELVAGIPHMTRVASRLGMTVPALAAVLKAEGTTFAGLREELLFRLSREYLADGHLALVDVAFAVGFIDFDVFESTFARWSGGPPRSYRATDRGAHL